VRICLTVALLSLLLLAGLYSNLSEFRQSGTFATDPPSPYVHYTPQGRELGQILVVHGLDSSKEMMNLLSLGLSDAGFNVYAMDLPGHGDSKVGFNAILAGQAINAALDSLGPNTIVIGHSLSGALLLDLAADRSFGTMVLLSPAPTPVDGIRASRVLVLTGRFDLPRIRSFVPRLKDAGAGSIELQTVPWSGHAGYILQPGTIRKIVAWLGGDASRLNTSRRIFFSLLGIVSAMLIAVLWFQGSSIASEPVNPRKTILLYISACTLALLICGAGVVWTGLRLFATDYLVSFVLLMGIALTPWTIRKCTRKFSQIPVGLFAAACVIAFAVFIGSELVHLTVNGGRLWRFAAIALAVLPLSFADEVLLRTIRPWWKAAGIAALTRILMASFMVTGVLTTNRNDAFLVLIVHFIVLLWMALWLIGELLRRRTQDPLATAVFTALIQAWIFAAVFVLT